MTKIGSEKSPGLKILWLWTIGTAAILVTNVVRTRLRDSEEAVKAEQHQQTTPSDPVLAASLQVSEEVTINEDKL